MSSQLEPRQAAFVREYVIDFNGTQAAIRAGYSSKAASQQASYLLANPKVQAQLSAAVDRREKRTEVTAARVVEKLATIAFAEGDAAVEIRDQLKALDILAKHTGVYRDNIVQIFNVIQSPQWVQLRAVLVMALDPYPKARAAVMAALEEHAASAAGDESAPG